MKVMYSVYKKYQAKMINNGIIKVKNWYIFEFRLSFIIQIENNVIAMEINSLSLLFLIIHMER